MPLVEQELLTLQFMDSDYPFGILKLFLYNNVVPSLDYTKNSDYGGRHSVQHY